MHRKVYKSERTKRNILLWSLSCFLSLALSSECLRLLVLLVPVVLVPQPQGAKHIFILIDAIQSVTMLILLAFVSPPQVWLNVVWYDLSLIWLNAIWVFYKYGTNHVYCRVVYRHIPVPNHSTTELPRLRVLSVDSAPWHQNWTLWSFYWIQVLKKLKICQIGSCFSAKFGIEWQSRTLVCLV